MSELFTEAETWVGVGLVLFFLVLIYLKVPGAAAKALDGRAEKIQAALDEAQRLRDEASALLNELRVGECSAHTVAQLDACLVGRKAAPTDGAPRMRTRARLAPRATVGGNMDGTAHH
jgi:hypothetical protein